MAQVIAKKHHRGSIIFFVVLGFFVLLFALSLGIFLMYQSAESIPASDANPVATGGTTTPSSADLKEKASLTTDLQRMSVVSQSVTKEVTIAATVGDPSAIASQIENLVTDTKGTVEVLRKFENLQGCDLGVYPVDYSMGSSSVMEKSPATILPTYPTYPGNCHAYNVFMTFRVPSASLATVRGSLKEIIGTFDEESLVTQDVSTQSSQIEAQLSASLEEQAALETLLAKTQDLSQVLQIRQQLTNLRTQISYLQSSKAELSKNLDQSLITVYLTKSTTETQQALTFVQRIANYLNNVVGTGVVVVSILGYGLIVLPIIIVVMIVAYVLSMIMRAAQRKKERGQG